jgi:hypothetical protein
LSVLSFIFDFIELLPTSINAHMATRFFYLCYCFIEKFCLLMHYRNFVCWCTTDYWRFVTTNNWKEQVCQSTSISQISEAYGCGGFPTSTEDGPDHQTGTSTMHMIGGALPWMFPSRQKVWISIL